MTRFADLNTPESFNDLLPSEQDALRLWVRLALKPAKSIGGKFSHSYALKHYAEDALDWYVSNGQLKGAMLAEGYRWEQCEGTRRNPNPNWVFNSQRRCRHRMISTRWDYRFNCPILEQRPSRYGDAFPTLCQASAAELAAFDQLNARAVADRERADQRERGAE